MPSGRTALLCALIAVQLAACGSPPTGTPEELAAPFGEAEVTLVDGDAEIDLDVYVADTADLRRRGLMGWEHLPDDTGMLFVYEEDATSGFWMKDTLLALSIAFIGAAGTVHEIIDMEPCRRDPCPTYRPAGAYRYALEVEQGYFDAVGIGPGARVEGLDAVDA